MTDTSSAILGSFSDQMSRTPQSPRWHGEGDVLTHTRMVCEALCNLPEFQALPERRRELLLDAARLHDIGKISTTCEIGGVTEAMHHAPVGSRMARQQLWLAGMCGSKEKIEWRETICHLIRYHSFPPHAIDAEDGAVRLHRIAAASSLLPDFSLRMLCILAKADMLGRLCEDRELMLERIELCEALAGEEGCLDGSFCFHSAHAMHAYLSGKDIWKDQELYDDTWGTVFLLSGLPGTGKDTWIRQNLPDLPMISLDEIRRERKISPTKHQGLVANLAKEQAKEYLRRHRPFVWNATNITRTTRQQLVSMFESYKANVHIIYLETDRQTLLSRNCAREYSVPQAVIEEMVCKLELPEAYEAREVDWIQL